MGDDVYLCTEHQFALLRDACGGRIVDRTIGPDLLSALNAPALLACCNIVPMSPVHVAGLLPNIVPAEWRVQKEVDWSPGQRSRLTSEWLSRLWAYINAECESLVPFAECGVPMLPTTSGTLLALVPSAVAVVMDDAGIEDVVLKVSDARSVLPLVNAVGVVPEPPFNSRVGRRRKQERPCWWECLDSASWHAGTDYDDLVMAFLVTS